MSILNKITRKFTKISSLFYILSRIKDDLDKIRQAIGRIENRQIQSLHRNDFKTSEFKVFSQNGEDGIIQFLIRNIKIDKPIFIEFGVENYTESNTRFLLKNNYWSGLVIDGSIENIKYIKNDQIYWKHNLKAIQGFITKENINQLIQDNGIAGEIGLLSIDIDGNDYWVWQAINIVNPAIVVTEYNFRFGKEKAVTIPYRENFIRSEVHHSMIYYGASLKALVELGQKKGYAFVGCNSAGNNAFFVRNDLKPDYIKELTVDEGYVAAQFRESRDENGQLIFLSSKEEEEILLSLPVVEV